MAKIISIHSFRGGTGKSNLTANIAVAVASQGKRVGIVDTDIQSPGIHVILGLDEEDITHSLNDYLWGNCGLDKIAYNVTPNLKTSTGETADISGQVYLVPSSLNAGEIARVLREGFDVGLLNDGFQELVKHLDLDYLFIDTHPGLNEETLLSIIISDALIVILRPDRQDYLGTAVTLEVAQKLDVPQLMLMVNKMPRRLDPDVVRPQVEEKYGVTVAGLFHENDEMLELASGGIFSLIYPDHPFSQEVHAVAQTLMG